MSKSYSVEARPWAQGWELHVAGVGVTQVRTLDKSHQQVLDFLETVEEIREGETPEIRITPQLGGLEQEVARVRIIQAEADRMRGEVALALRAVTKRLRTETGLSVTDTAAVLGVSRGRVSQLDS